MHLAISNSAPGTLVKWDRGGHAIIIMIVSILQSFTREAGMGNYRYQLTYFDVCTGEFHVGYAYAGFDKFTVVAHAQSSP